MPIKINKANAKGEVSIPLLDSLSHTHLSTVCVKEGGRKRVRRERNRRASNIPIIHEVD